MKSNRKIKVPLTRETVAALAAILPELLYLRAFGEGQFNNALLEIREALNELGCQIPEVEPVEL